MKKILITLLAALTLFSLTACSNKTNKSPTFNGVSYNVNGVSVNLDKEEEQDGMKYKTSSFFTKDYKVSTTTYIIYKDSNGDKYDLSNIAFRLDINADIMNSESRIDREKELIMKKDTFENVEQSQKTINGITWESFSFNNAYDKDYKFKEHLYITERQVNNYYYVYKIYFSYADNINEFEEAFMNSITF